jgi:hypothetical protein
MDGLGHATPEVVKDEREDDSSRKGNPPRRTAPAAGLRGRVIRAAVVAIALAYALYLVPMNVFLSTSLFGIVVNNDPVTLDIHFERGWSWFPTRIYARNLDIRSSDSNVEWILHLDEVEFDLSLLSIPRRRFEVAHAHGRGVSLRARRKLDAAPAGPEEVAMLPPVPGFPPYSVRPAGPPSLERWFDEHYDLIRVRLEDVVAEDVREVWIDDARFQGDARITGRFFLHPIRAVDVGPAHIEIRDGAVTAGPTLAIAHDVKGTIDVTIDRFDPRETPLASILRYVSGTTDLRAGFEDAKLLPLPKSKALSISGELEAKKVALHVRRGVLGAGTNLALAVRRAVVANPDVAWSAGIDLTGAIENEGDPLRLEIGLADVEFRLGKRPPSVRSAQVDIALETRQLNLADDPFRDVNGDLRTKNIDVQLGKPELRDPLAFNGGATARFIVRGWRNGTEAIALDEADADLIGVSARRKGAKESLATVKRAGVKVRKGTFLIEDVLATARADVLVAVEGGDIRDPVIVDAFLAEETQSHAAGKGSFSAKANLHVDKRVVQGRVTTQTRGLGVRTELMTLWGDTDTDLDVVRWNMTTARMSLGPSRLSVTNASGRIGTAPSRPESPLASQARAFTFRRVQFEGKAKNFDVTAPGLVGLDGRLAFEGVEVPDARALQRALPEKTSIRLESGRLRGSGHLELGGEQRAGTGYIALDLDNGAAAVGRAQVQGNIEMRVAVRNFDPRTNMIDLSGSRAQLDKVEIRGLSVKATNWRGEAVLHESSLRLDENRQLDSLVRFDADDARPILAALLADVAPKFLTDLVKMPRLAAWGRLHVARDVFLVSDVDASGGDVAFRGCYGVHGDVKEGAFIVEKGPLSVGIGLEPDGDSYPRFFGLDGWLAAHARTLKERNTASKAKAR